MARLARFGLRGCVDGGVGGVAVTAIEEIRAMRERLKRIIGEMNRRDSPEQALPLQMVLADLQKVEIDADVMDWPVPL
jgi:hypothetical protein